MRVQFGFKLLLAAALLPLPPNLSAQTLLSIMPSPPSAAYREDQILVQPRTGISDNSLRQAVGGADLEVRQRFPGLRGLQVIGVPVGETAASFIAQLRASRLVEYAEPDFIRQLDLTPNDPQYANGTAWALNNFGQSGGVID